MSRITEKKAKKYLIQEYKNDKFKFYDIQQEENGFDLWMEIIDTGSKNKIELKATEGKYSKRSDIFQKLYFSAENEVKNFEEGITKIVRIFLGDNPPKVFIFDRKILNLGAKFEIEYRAKIVGSKNYDFIKEMRS